MKKLFLIPLVFYIFQACTSDNEPEPANTTVQIRLKNTSSLDYADVYVSSGYGEFNYGDIGKQGTTSYGEFAAAYRYAYVRLKIDGNVYEIQPIDFVGESLLKKGNYTYEIGADPSPDGYRLTIDLVKD